MKRGLLKLLSLALSIVMLAGVIPAGAAQTVKTIRVFSIGLFSSPTGNSVLAGDINSDNKVNNKDLTRLFQYLSDWDVEINRAALDVNGDNKVNNKDLTRLFQYLSDWDVKIFPEPILCEHAGQTEIRNAKEPTCIEEGYTGDLYCLECGTLLETGSYIEKGPHTGGTATCHSKALCEVCGVEYGEIDPGNHDGGTEIRDAFAPTCMGNGYEGTTYCLGCGVALAYGAILPTTGEHINTVIRGDYPATCSNSGYTGDTYCADCGEKLAEGEYIPPTGEHANLEYRGGYPATCSQMGYTGDVYCKDCGLLLYGGTYIEPTGEHTLSEWLSDTYIHWKTCLDCGIMLEQEQHTGGIATCNKRAVCEICGSEYGYFDDTNHNFTFETVEPTCFDVGYTRYTCLDCGFSYVDNYVPVLEHTGGVATCHSAAVCERCGTEYGPWDYNNHDGGTYVEGFTVPTATEPGYTGNIICCGCNQVLEYGTYYYEHIHYGGHATYYKKAVCEGCNEEYGEYTQIWARDQLNYNQKGIYDILENAIYSMNTDWFSVMNYVDPQTYDYDINVAFKAIAYDRPDYFWMPRNIVTSTTTNSRTGAITNVECAFDHVYIDDEDPDYNWEIHYPISRDEREWMQKQLEEKLLGIVDMTMNYTTDFDKEVFIHDYLCDNVTYDYVTAGYETYGYSENDPTGAPAGAAYNSMSFTAYGALMNGLAVCEGYSRAMQLICQRVGIPCGLITGLGNGGPHMWNIINPGDGCYYLDVTFDDPDTAGWIQTYDYFNLTKSGMEEALHTFDPLFIQGNEYWYIDDEGYRIEIDFNFFDTYGDHTALSYYNGTGAYIDGADASAAAEYVIKMYNNGYRKAALKVMGVDCLDGESAKAAYLALKGALAGQAVQLSGSYSYTAEMLIVWMLDGTNTY